MSLHLIITYIFNGALLRGEPLSKNFENATFLADLVLLAEKPQPAKKNSSLKLRGLQAL